MMLVVLLIAGLLIMLASAERPWTSRAGGVGDRSQNGGFGPARDAITGSVSLQDSWTELDEYQLRRLLDS